MKYNKDILNRFINEKVAINVETQQEWIDFMKLLEKETDLKWMGCKIPTYFDHWHRHQGESSIGFNFRGNNGLGYSSCDFYQDNGYEIIKYKDLIKGAETMTNIEKVSKALENANEDKVKEVLDFLGYKEDSKFIPEYGETYYFITGLGQFSSQDWRDDEYDNYVLLMNNAYRTKEDAEQALDLQVRKAKLIKEIEDSSDVIDWNDMNQKKYYFWVSRLSNSLRVHSSSSPQTQGATLTTDKLFLEKLIATRSDEVKELLFDIK